MSGFARRLAGLPWRQIAGEAFDRTLLAAQAFCAVHVVHTHVFSLAYVRAPSPIPLLLSALSHFPDALLIVVAAPRTEHAPGVEPDGGRGRH